MTIESGGTAKRPRKLRRLGIAALMVGGAGGAVAAIGSTADAVPSCPAAKEQGALPYVQKVQGGMNLRVCQDGTIAGKINLQQIAEQRNPNAVGMNLPSVRLPWVPPKLP